MKNSLLKSFFSTGLQAIAVQVLGILFFLLISLYLPKESFGLISKSNAISVMFAAFLSFGMEQVVTRRIAASDTSDWAAAAFLFHALVGSVASFVILLVLRFLFSDSIDLRYLPWFFVAQALIYMATPFKQYLNAKQRFGPYGIIAVISNLFKVAAGYVLLKKGLLSINTASVVLIISATIEFGLLFTFIKSKTTFRFSFKKTAYIKLIKESFPLYITAIFDALLKRADTILLGFLATNAITGDYAFAYKAFEMACLPVFIIGPVILAKLARTFTNARPEDVKKEEIRSLFIIEIFLAMLIPLVLNLLWSPLLDHFTKGKYGSINATEFFILSLCVPLYFAINLLWTLCFTSKKYKKVSMITLTSAICNLVLNLILIPWLGGVGAAISFLITTLIQAGSYFYIVKREIIELPLATFFSILLFFGVAYYTSILLFSFVWLQLVVAVIIYVGLSMLFRQIGLQQFHILKSYLKK